MVFRKQHLGLRYAHYCIYCLYGYLSIFTENYWFTPIHSIPSSNTEFILIFSLSIFVNPFTDSEKLNFCYPQCIYLFDPSTYKYQYPSLLPPLHTLLRLQHLVLGSPPRLNGCLIQPALALVPDTWPLSHVQITLSLCLGSDTLQWARLSCKCPLHYAWASALCTVPLQLCPTSLKGCLIMFSPT